VHLPLHALFQTELQQDSLPLLIPEKMQEVAITFIEVYIQFVGITAGQETRMVK